MPDELLFSLPVISRAADQADVRVVAVQVTNPTGAPLYVWATPRAMTYDPNTETLAVRFGENPSELKDIPGLQVISGVHPRIPSQLIMGPGKTARLQMQVPPVLHVVDLDAPSRGLALELKRVPVEEIRSIRLEVAVSNESLTDFRGIPQGQIASALRERCRFVHAVVST